MVVDSGCVSRPEYASVYLPQISVGSTNQAGEHGTMVSGAVHASPGGASHLSWLVCYDVLGLGVTADALYESDVLAAGIGYRVGLSSVKTMAWAPYYGPLSNEAIHPLSPSLWAAIREAEEAGTLLVFSAGNRYEGRYAYSPMLNGFASAPTTVVVNSFSPHDLSLVHSCACILLSAPSGYETQASDVVVFNGTSSSAPLVSATALRILAEAGQNGGEPLLPMQVRRILIRSAVRPTEGEASGKWLRNAAGLWHSPLWGFGVPDLGAAEELARKWTSHKETEFGYTADHAEVRQQMVCSPAADGSRDTVCTFEVPHFYSSLRAEEVGMNVTALTVEELAPLSISLSSPSGTIVRMMESGIGNDVVQIASVWVLSTPAFHGEEMAGTWECRFEGSSPAGLVMGGVDLVASGYRFNDGGGQGSRGSSCCASDPSTCCRRR